MMSSQPSGSDTTAAWCLRQKLHWSARGTNKSVGFSVTKAIVMAPQWQPPSKRGIALPFYLGLDPLAARPPEIVDLAYPHALRAQDVVGRGRVEIEIRH